MKWVCLLVLLLTIPTFGQVYNIKTFAGNFATYGMTGGFAGDGGAPTSAAMIWPTEIVFDSAGNFYTADLWNNRIRAVCLQATTCALLGTSVAAGTINTVAGSTATNGFGGDGGPATSAKMAHPVGMAMDASDNLYIADQQNGAVRRVDHATGIISTIVGTDQSNYFPTDGIPINFALTSADVTNGTTTTYHGTITNIPSNTTYIYVQGFANAANNGRFQVSAGSTSTTLVLTNTAGVAETHSAVANWAALNFPQGVAVDGNGNLLISDSNNARIRAVCLQVTTCTIFGISIAPNNIKTIAGNGCSAIGLLGCYSDGGGVATSASLNQPLGIGLDPSGNLYIADAFNNLVRKVTPSGTISTFAGEVAILSITNVTNNGSTNVYTYTLTSGPALVTPTAAAFREIVTIAGCTSNTNNGTFTITSTGAGTFTIASTTGISEAESSATGQLGVPGYSGDNGQSNAALINEVYDVKADASGVIYLAEQRSNVIRRVMPSGVIDTIAGNFASYGNNGLFAGDGGLATLAGLGCRNTGAGCIQGGVGPVGVAPDNHGHIFIGDSGNNVVRELTLFIGMQSLGGITISNGVTIK